jgi:hypothetical protein
LHLNAGQLPIRNLDVVFLHRGIHIAQRIGTDLVSLPYGVHSSAFASKRRQPTWIVPSTIVPKENNIVLYPNGVGYEATVLNAEPFEFDARLARGAG